MKLTNKSDNAPGIEILAVVDLTGFEIKSQVLFIRGQRQDRVVQMQLRMRQDQDLQKKAISSTATLQRAIIYKQSIS